jgi:ABC-2 type transport system ATP-binding protein
MQPIVRAEQVEKRFGNIHALAGVSLEIEAGIIYALLGPNGAGKTTLIRVLATLLRPDGGTATVAGIDVVRDPTAVRNRIGLAGQFAAVDEYLTGREAVEMVGRLYNLSPRTARDRAAEVLERFSLAADADRLVRTYSGGMKRRLDLAASLVGRPDVLFLDEPTTGLDPHSRRQLWEAIRRMVGGGTTVLLTTQYLEEADQLADRILVIDHGKAIAEGTSDELKGLVGAERIEVTVTAGEALERAQRVLARFAVGEQQADARSRSLITPIAGGAAVLTQALRELDRAQVAVQDVGLRRPTLDDVFLSLTGHGTGPEAAEQ